MDYLVGVDEAGRGPLAGPVAVGVAVVKKGFDWSKLPGVTDSKALKEPVREAIYKQAHLLKKSGHIGFKVVLVSAKEIDKNGIVPSINKALRKGMEGLNLNPTKCKVLLDGGLKAPDDYKNQKTIIKGDLKEKVIGLASILAKVTRDRHMIKLSRRDAFSLYELQKHKGYGTKSHRELIKKHGISEVHRQTFCRNLLLN